jgi:hypothetical protein
VLCVGVFYGSDLFTGVCARVCCIVLCLSYVHITFFYFVHVNQQCVPVCPNYYSFSLPHPSPPAIIMFGTINIDVIFQQVGRKGQQVKYGKLIQSVKIVCVYISFENNKIK